MSEASTRNVLVRAFPIDLLEQVDAYAAEAAGDKARPSREMSIVALIRRGLGDVHRIVKDKKRPR